MATIEGLAANGAVLSYMDGSTAKTLVGVKSIPAMGSDPEKIDVTHLGSARKSYIPGIQDSDNLEFDVVYLQDNYANAIAASGKSVVWTLTYADGLSFKFTGTASTKFGGGEVNGALSFTLVVVVSDGPTPTPATTASAGK